MNYKARIFQALSYRYQNNNIIRTQMSKQNMKVKAIVFYTLLNLKIRNEFLSTCEHTISEKRKQKMREKVLDEWIGLYSYFSKFTKS